MAYPQQKPEPMDDRYRPLYHQAEALQNSFHARLDDPFNPMAMAMKQEADALVSDISSNRHLDDVEYRIKTIQTHLNRATDTLTGNSTVMSQENGQYLHDHYAQMRREVQAIKQKPYFDQPRTRQAEKGDEL